jgi:GGDEF domain-containing protein
LDAYPEAGAELMRVHDEGQVSRDKGTLARSATTGVRAHVAREREEIASRRDENASRRDEQATARDLAADEVDKAAAALDGAEVDDDPIMRAVRSIRERAATARLSALSDRERAARDRDAAARDRELLRVELERFYLDELTGAYCRQFGEVLLRHEIGSARIRGSTLVLGLLTVNDGSPAEASDNYPAHIAAIGDVFLAIEEELRPGDPIVRWAENQFVCTVAEAANEAVRDKLERARRKVRGLHPIYPIDVRVHTASLSQSDTLARLVARALGQR